MKPKTNLKYGNFPESYKYFHRPKYLPGYTDFVYGYYHIKYNDITVSFYENYVLVGLRDFGLLARYAKITIKPNIFNIKLILDMAEIIIELDFEKKLNKGRLK